MTRLAAAPLFALLLLASAPNTLADAKRDVILSIDKQSADMIRLSDQI